MNLNQVERDRFTRWQLDSIEVVDCPEGHSGKLQVGDRVYIHRFDPPDSDEKGFDAIVELDETGVGCPTVILVAEEWAMMTMLEAAWEGFMVHILDGDRGEQS